MFICAWSMCRLFERSKELGIHKWDPWSIGWLLHAFGRMPWTPPHFDEYLPQIEARATQIMRRFKLEELSLCASLARMSHAP